MQKVSEELVRCEIREKVACLTLNRVQQHNARSREMDEIFLQLLTKLRHMQDVHVVIVTGAGQKAFCAGSDLSEMGRVRPEDAERLMEEHVLLYREMERFPLPMVAAVNGYAIGGGMELALACDVVLASKQASFSLPEVKLGIVSIYGLEKLKACCGSGVAKELLLSGRRISAEEAYQRGIVHLLVEGDFSRQVWQYAEKLAEGAPLAVSLIKMAAQGQQEDELLGEAALLFQSKDFDEGLTAFREKRKPHFIGR